MKRSALPTRSLMTLMVAGALAAPAWAQEERPPEKPPGPPPTAAEAKAERQKNSAAKLAGLLNSDELKKFITEKWTDESVIAAF